MADKIIAGPTDADSKITMLYYYDIPAGIKVTIGSTNIVESPSADLPFWADAVLTQQDKSDLDSGDALYVFDAVYRADGTTNAQLQTLVQQRAADRKTVEQARYQKRNEFIGIDVPTS